MNLKSYLNLISNSDDLKKDVSSELRTIIKEYPYFHSARALYLKNLKNKRSFKYNNELKITAAHTVDRTVLFEFITSESSKNKSEVDYQFRKKIHSPNIPEKEDHETNRGDKNFEKSVSFSKNEVYTFLEWLQISVNKFVEKKQSNIKEEKNFIIDRFIEKNPKITSLKEYSKEVFNIPEDKSDTSLMTETLANIYLKQKKFTKAIEAYEILSLKYPEKNSFFARKIKKIKNLQSE